MYVITSTIRFFQHRRDHHRLNKPTGTAWHSLVQYSTVHRGACTVHPESTRVRHCAIPLLRAYITVLVRGSVIVIVIVVFAVTICSCP
mmetsp:Transcript_30678/g.31195  ORF Transcript_30678/g.31195 Transcript_30678/m.31195 type:complete len:88 (-) Transcript_30678:258-521(-)